ncbi:MAG: hypothetical protein JWP89_6558 [Schlesneria sp.]|nr:hypothetical protein [Schlesneria sp.]
MSSSQSEPRKTSRWLARLPRLRVAMGVALVLTAVGFGVHSAMNRRVEAIDDSELEVLDDLDVESSPDRPRPLAATITDVVPAVHREAAGDTNGVQLAAHATGVRPESQPPVWLSGTIEDSGSGATGADQNTNASPFRRFNR